jgi:hypothetical protein
MDLKQRPQRAPSGDRLSPEQRQRLSRALEAQDLRRLGQRFGVSPETVARAAAGCRIMRASRAVIVAGLDALDGDART